MVGTLWKGVVVVVVVVIYVQETSRRVWRRAKLRIFKYRVLFIKKSKTTEGKKDSYTDSPESLIPWCYSAPINLRKHFILKRRAYDYSLCVTSEALWL